MSEDRVRASRRPTTRPADRNDSKAETPLDREHATAELKRFLDLAISEMQLAVEYGISSGESGTPPSEAGIEVAFRGQDEGLLLERNAELLIALEHIAHRWLRLDPRMHDRVRFDCSDYRATRLEELKLSARVAAQRVRETGQPFRFNPMSSRERRIIHLELNGAAGVRTVSEDAGDRRHLVIYPVSRK
ncbi:MAG TPA: R3H domain-containing nucleic acid-binding protein [Candidatus Acidoferrales bacterium]|nr:R3H domain-containing nucleic acid-binding protein [Candidatus Acidoferrales bacterium]